MDRKVKEMQDFLLLTSAFFLGPLLRAVVHGHSQRAEIQVSIKVLCFTDSSFNLRPSIYYKVQKKGVFEFEYDFILFFYIILFIF